MHTGSKLPPITHHQNKHKTDQNHYPHKHDTLNSSETNNLHEHQDYSRPKESHGSRHHHKENHGVEEMHYGRHADIEEAHREHLEALSHRRQRPYTASYRSELNEYESYTHGNHKTKEQVYEESYHGTREVKTSPTAHAAPSIQQKVQEEIFEAINHGNNDSMDIHHPQTANASLEGRSDHKYMVHMDNLTGSLGDEVNDGGGHTFLSSSPDQHSPNSHHFPNSRHSNDSYHSSMYGESSRHAVYSSKHNPGNVEMALQNHNHSSNSFLKPSHPSFSNDSYHIARVSSKEQPVANAMEEQAPDILDYMDRFCNPHIIIMFVFVVIVVAMIIV